MEGCRQGHRKQRARRDKVQKRSVTGTHKPRDLPSNAPAPCPHPGKLLGQRERRAPLLVLEGAAETHGLRHSPRPFHSRRPSSGLLPPHMDPPFLPGAAFEACSFIPLFFRHPYVEQPSGAREQGGRTESIPEIQVLNSRVDATKPCRSTPSGILRNRGYRRGAQKGDKNCPREIGRETGRESSTVKARSGRRVGCLESSQTRKWT